MPTVLCYASNLMRPPRAINPVLERSSHWKYFWGTFQSLELLFSKVPMTGKDAISIQSALNVLIEINDMVFVGNTL